MAQKVNLKKKDSAKLTQSELHKTDKKVLEQEKTLKEEIEKEETMVLQMQKSLEEAQVALRDHKSKLEALEKKSSVSKEVIPLKLQSPNHKSDKADKKKEDAPEDSSKEKGTDDKFDKAINEIDKVGE